MAVSFVPARPEDTRALSELRCRVWLTTYRGIYPDDMLDNFDYAFHDERNRAWIASERHEVRFITLEGENIGYLILVKGDPMHVQSLYLLEAYRGRGYGREAMAFIREACRRHGASSFFLTCHPRNRRALGFYAKMGGVITGRDEGNDHEYENSVRLDFRI